MVEVDALKDDEADKEDMLSRGNLINYQKRN